MNTTDGYHSNVLNIKVTASCCQLAVPPDKALKHKQFQVDIYRENDHDATVHITNMATGKHQYKEKAFTMDMIHIICQITRFQIKEYFGL